MMIIETIGIWGVKTSEADYIRFITPKPGDVIKLKNGKEGRIEQVGPNDILKEDELIICENEYSVFLLENGQVDISGGPFKKLKKDELKPLHELKLVHFWNWGDNLPGAGKGVDYYLNRPVFAIKNKFNVGDMVKIPSGMGGTFDAILLFYDAETKHWQCKINMPENPDWDKWIVWVNEKEIKKI